MASPYTPYLTQQWSGLTHYICPRCGYNSFQTDALDRHRCAPALEGKEPTASPASSSEPPPAQATQAVVTPLPTKGT